MGVPRTSRTVLLSTASTVTSAQAAAPAPAASGLLSASTVNTTSSAVTGSPSCQTASSRMVKVHVFPVSSLDQEDARSGWYDVPGPSRTRPENTSPTSMRSARLRAVTGVIDWGTPTTPSR